MNLETYTRSSVSSVVGRGWTLLCFEKGEVRRIHLLEAENSKVDIGKKKGCLEHATPSLSIQVHLFYSGQP